MADFELVSIKFAGNKQLKDCANFDRAHVATFANAKGEHVRKIQEALQELDDAKIDQKELDDARYGPSTAQAVRTYKGPPRDIRRPGQPQADDIVGILTIRRMDRDLAVRDGRQQQVEDLLELLKSSDVFVKIQGNDSSIELDASEFAVFRSRVETKGYLKLHGAVITIGFTGSFTTPATVNKIVDRIRNRRNEIGSRPLGRICIIGGSSGGKNAIQLANRLLSEGLPTAYIGVADAAFSTGDPLFSNPGPGAVGCPVKDNFFQTFGNALDSTGEVHDAIAGFNNVPLDGSLTTLKAQFEQLPPAEREKKSVRQGFANSAHASIFAEGLARAQANAITVLRAGVVD